jgi:HK97 family phage portal protein
MRLLGFDITRAKNAPPAVPSLPASYNWLNNWWNVIREPFAGAWQRNMEVRCADVLTYSTLYACITLIASDIGKLCLRVVEQDADGIWSEVENPAFSPVLRKPNRYQTRIKFIEQWITSKLITGNTYVLKERDQRNVVVRLYVLDPRYTKPLLAPDGAIYYQLGLDYLTGLGGTLLEGDPAGYQANEYNRDTVTVTVPASEIIHDVMTPLYHPLCGVSPITACGLAALQGLNIQRNQVQFFNNGSNPGGILSAPGMITDEVAKRIKDHWEANYTGQNVGKVAVLGDGLKYEAVTMNATDSQVINQLRWTSEQVCSTFHVPPYMVGVGPPPNYNNIEALNQQYYSQCLQALIEQIELLLDEGLGLLSANQSLGTEFDLDDLLRMDTATQYRTYGDGIKAGLMAPNEGRLKINLPPKTGGDTPYLQQQNYSLEALDKRDSADNPFPAAKPALPAPPKPAAEPQPAAAAVIDAQKFRALLDKGSRHAAT